ncbi:unnamed protein product [Schistosoma margrebowiei]|uniref:Uncharacterized protein n=1 Tax=Schistosoma margrebowiei TaxID=48269 RepID=A0A183LB18_9TREM|nr:unnamed protein product [Schistosoma margrebowiei]
MESSRPKEERKTTEHITPGNGNRHEKNEQELDETRKGGPGQGGGGGDGSGGIVVGGNQQETLNLSFILLGTRQQGVPVILMELVLHDGFDPVSHSSNHLFILT